MTRPPIEVRDSFTDSGSPDRTHASSLIQTNRIAVRLEWGGAHVDHSVVGIPCESSELSLPTETSNAGGANVRGPGQGESAGATLRNSSWSP